MLAVNQLAGFGARRATTAGGGGGWQPSDAPGLSIWLKGGVGISTDANGVTAWADQSGNSRHATVDDARYPQTTTSYFGGATTVLFGVGGVADELNVASGMTGHIFYAIRPTITYNASTTAVGVLAYTGSNASFRLGAANGALTNEIMWTWRGASSFDGVSSTALASVSQSEHIIGLTWTGSSYAIHVDGSADISDLASGSGTTQMSGSGVFGSDGAGGAPLQAAIAEIIVYTSMDTTLRQKIEGYLAHKYGFATVLPADHPYKAAAPAV